MLQTEVRHIPGTKDYIMTLDCKSPSMYKLVCDYLEESEYIKGGLEEGTLHFGVRSEMPSTLEEILLEDLTKTEYRIIGYAPNENTNSVIFTCKATAPINGNPVLPNLIKMNGGRITLNSIAFMKENEVRAIVLTIAQDPRVLEHPNPIIAFCFDRDYNLIEGRAKKIFKNIANEASPEELMFTTLEAMQMPDAFIIKHFERFGFITLFQYKHITPKVFNGTLSKIIMAAIAATEEEEVQDIVAAMIDIITIHRLDPADYIDIIFGAMKEVLHALEVKPVLKDVSYHVVRNITWMSEILTQHWHATISFGNRRFMNLFGRAYKMHTQNQVINNAGPARTAPQSGVTNSTPNTVHVRTSDNTTALL